MVHTERAALIDDLENLDDARWEEQSLCGDWTVHDVVAHLVDTARTTRLGFVVGLARARFDFHRQNARGVERCRGASPQETLERLGRVASRRSTPPAPLDSRLVEENVRLERRIAQSERLAALGRMAATVAHEVKNPLSAIKSIAQVLREDEYLKREYARDLELIVGETDRLSRSVTQMLSFARSAPQADEPRRGDIRHVKVGVGDIGTE